MNIWKRSKSKFKYPESVRVSSFDVNKKSPTNEFERKWNEKFLNNYYSFNLGVYAENALKQEDYKILFGNVITKNGKLEKVVFPFEEEVEEQYEWRSYDMPKGFPEEDVKEINLILKNRFKIDIETDVRELNIYEPDEMLGRENHKITVTTINELWRPYGFGSGGYMTTMHNFEMTKIDGTIHIDRSRF